MKGKKLYLLDTSFLCVLLEIPGRDTCEGLTTQGAKKQVEDIEKSGGILVLPLAAIIETGNHISQASRDRYKLGEKFKDILEKIADGSTPWQAAQVEVNALWNANKLKELAKDFPQQANAQVALGDLSIIQLANFLHETGAEVKILTCDKALKAHQPVRTAPKKRRR